MDLGSSLNHTSHCIASAFFRRKPRLHFVLKFQCSRDIVPNVLKFQGSGCNVVYALSCQGSKDSNVFSLKLEVSDTNWRWGVFISKFEISGDFSFEVSSIRRQLGLHFEVSDAVTVEDYVFTEFRLLSSIFYCPSAIIFCFLLSVYYIPSRTVCPLFSILIINNWFVICHLVLSCSSPIDQAHVLYY